MIEAARGSRRKPITQVQAFLELRGGWKAREADCISRYFYDGYIGALFMEDYSLGPYGKEAKADGADGTLLIDADVRWKSTRKKRADEFNILMERVEAEGLEPYDMPKPKVKKARQKKVWKVGQKIRQGNLRESSARATLQVDRG